MEVSNIERELLVKKIKSLSDRFRDESLGNFLMDDKNRRRER